METIRICKDRNILKEYLTSRKKAVTAIIMSLLEILPLRHSEWIHPLYCVQMFMGEIRRYTAIMELDETVLNQLINRLLITLMIYRIPYFDVGIPLHDGLYSIHTFCSRHDHMITALRGVTGGLRRPFYVVFTAIYPLCQDIIPTHVI